MEKNSKRKRSLKNYGESECKIYEDECILPFRSESWLHLKKLICSNNKDLKTLEEILSCLRAIKSRDSEKGRIALDATYELFFAQYVLMTTSHDSAEGKENLTRIFGVTVNRVVGHLQDMQVCLENYRGATIRETLKFFKTDVDIADYRNDFAHGNIPSFYVLWEAIDKLTELIIDVYWEFFDGGITWPKVVPDGNLKIMENIQKSLCMVQFPDLGLANYEKFIIQNNVKQLRLLSEDGDIFELARFTGECAIETENEYLKKQYTYWVDWLIKRITKEKLVTEWEIKELGKICVALDLEKCLIKIFEHYNVDMSDYSSFYNSSKNDMETKDGIEEVYVCGSWGS